MSLLVQEFSKVESFSIKSVSNVSGELQVTITATLDNINLSEGDILTIVGNTDYNGTHTITSATQVTTDINLLTSTAYTNNNTTGQLLSQSYADTTSNWSASQHTPVNITLQRKDLVISECTTWGSGLVVAFVIDVSAIISVADSIYISSGGVYEGVYTVAEINYLGTGTLVRFSEDFISLTSGGYANRNSELQNYYVELGVTVDSNTTTLDLFPDLSGALIVDLHDILSPYFVIENEFDYNDISIRDTNLSKYFTFTTTEKWIGSSESENSYAEKFYFCIATRNIGEYGNMFSYVVRESGELPLAKWTTRGKNIAYLSQSGYPALPFALDILCDVGIVNKNEITRDVNGVQIADTDYALNDAQNALNRIRLEKYYAETVKKIDVSLNISLTEVKHFWEAISLSGELTDEYGNQDGKLYAGSCLNAVSTDTVITLPDFITISGSVSNDGTAVGTPSANTITFTAGTIYNISFSDTEGCLYHFPCIDKYTDARTLALIHGYRTYSLTTTVIYAAIENVAYSTQNDYFWHIKGMTKITDGGSEIIHVPKDINKNRLHTLGVGDEEYYQIGLLPIS